MPEGLRVIIRNAHETLAEVIARSVRFPTETGQVGLRPRCEPVVLSLEPGLLLARSEEGCQYVGTAGGLITCDGMTATVLTPLAVVGDSPEEVLPKLEQALQAPDDELKARNAFAALETAITRQLQQERQRSSIDGREA